MNEAELEWVKLSVALCSGSLMIYKQNQVQLFLDTYSRLNSQKIGVKAFADAIVVRQCSESFLNELNSVKRNFSY